MTEASLHGKPIFLKRGKRAILFIHGFTGTPDSLFPVAEKLAESGFTVSLPLLPGYGTTPEDMARHSGKDWIAAVFAAWDQLAENYQNPAVAGLSMGAALAIQIGTNRPVPAVAALAPALYIRDWRLPFIPIMKYIIPWEKSSVGNDIKGTCLREHCYSRFRLKSVQDLQYVMQAARKALPKLQAPLLTMQAQEDHTVPPSCMDDCFRWAGSAVKEKYRLTNSYHVITMDNEYLAVADRMKTFFSEHMPA